MKKVLLKLILVTVIAVMFNSCAKDGATGPAGPQGPAGSNGSSNVSTLTFNVTSGNWSYNSTNYEWYANLSVPSITTTELSTGTVQVFQGDGTGTYWAPVPYSFNGNEWGAVASVGNVTVSYTLSSGIPNNPGSWTYKVVVIPASIKYKHPNTNWSNYEELKSTFNL